MGADAGRRRRRHGAGHVSDEARDEARRERRGRPRATHGARARVARETRGAGKGRARAREGGGRRGEAPRARARRAPLKIAPRESFWRDHPVVVVERRNPSAQTGRAGDSGRRATRADDEARRSRGREGGHCARRAAPPSALPTRWARAAFAGTRIRRRRSPGYDPPRVNPPPAARTPRDSPPHAVQPSRDGVTNRALRRSPRRRVLLLAPHTARRRRSVRPPRATERDRPEADRRAANPPRPGVRAVVEAVVEIPPLLGRRGEGWRAESKTQNGTKRWKPDGLARIDSTPWFLFFFPTRRRMPRVSPRRLRRVSRSLRVLATTRRRRR